MQAEAAFTSKDFLRAASFYAKVNVLFPTLIYAGQLSFEYHVTSDFDRFLSGNLIVMISLKILQD